MSKVIFRGELDIRWQRSGWIVAAPLTFEASGVRRTIPAGFKFNGANIKWLFPVLFLTPYDERIARAAAVHDWLYSRGDRKTADKLFHSILKADGLDPVRRWMLWAGVRVFGGLWIDLAMVLAVACISCVSVPRVIIDKDGKAAVSTTETEALIPLSGDGADYVNRLTAAKGWESPAVDVSGDAASIYLWMSAACFAAALLAFCAAYMTHQHSLIAVGGILTAGSAAAVGMAQIAQYLWIAPVAAGVGLCWLGWRWRGKHIKNILKRPAEND